ncbi:preprotein translocase subunit SecE [Candidatus Dependentiae bacterium]|nr:preprotein translocase subunit SecE [Candidatus Dependentiae bacterium]
MNQISQFLKEVKVELSRVEWPKLDEWVGATAVTLILVVFFAIFLGLVDRVNSWLIFNKIFSYTQR